MKHNAASNIGICILILLTGCGKQSREPATEPPANSGISKTEKVISLFKREPEEPGKASLVTNGMSKTQVTELLGDPRGQISSGVRTTLMYDGVQLVFENGRLTDVPANLDQLIKTGKNDREKREQLLSERKKNSGPLPVYEPPPAIAAAPAAAPAGYVMRDENGQAVDHSRLIRRGKVTVIDFYADWCGPCRALAPQLDALLNKHRDVAFEKVNIDNWGSSVSKQYSVTSVPSVRVFDRNGNMVGPPTSSISKIEAMIKQAEKR